MKDRIHLWHRAAFVLCAFILLFTICLAEYTALFASADGKKTFKDSGFEMDYTNAAQGYAMVRYSKKTTKKLKLRVVVGEDTYTYDLTAQDDYMPIPFQQGSGSYKISLYIQTSGSKYSSVASKTLKVTLDDENLPFLCPNQYAWYTADSNAVAKSKELCANLSTDEEKFKAIYAYITKNVAYDFILALNVKSGYLPDVDATLKTKKGICFDYAALMACMLRVQGIPTKLCIGYADKTYHAWNMVYLNGSWERYDATFAVSGSKASKYTLERFY